MALMWSRGDHTHAQYWRCTVEGMVTPYSGYEDNAHLMHVMETGHTVVLVHKSEETFVAAGFTEEVSPC